MSTDPGLVADQLLAALAPLQPQLQHDVVVELQRRVDEEKFNDPAHALRIADAALVAAALLGEREADAIAARAKATALLFHGQAAAALPFYRRAEAHYQELDLPVQQVSVQAPLVHALNATGQQQAALQLARQVRSHCQQLGAPARRALAHLEMNVGTIRKQQGAFAASLAACNRAKALFVALADGEGVARAEMNRANVLQEMDRFADAASAYIAARAPLVATDHNEQQVALIDFNLGLLAERSGRFVEALQALEQARARFKPPLHRAAADLNRARIYNRLNLPDTALHLAQAARQIFVEQTMELDEGHALLVIGVAERQLALYTESAMHLEQAIASFATQRAEFWQATAQLALVETELQMAPATAAESLALIQANHDRAEQAEWPTVAVEAQLLWVRQELQRQPTPSAESHLRLQNAIATATEYHLTRHRLDGYSLLGRYHQCVDDPAAAWEAYQQAILQLAEIRSTLRIDELQLGYLADKTAIYWAAAALFLPTARANAAFEEPALLLYLCNLAATTPLPLRPNRAVTDAEPAVAQLRQRLRRLQEARQWQQNKLNQPDAPLAETQPKLAALEREIADCWRRLRIWQLNDGREVQAAIATAEPPSPESIQELATTMATAIQAQLHQHDALLVYTKTGDDCALLVVRPNAITVVPLAAAATIEATLQAWRFHIRDHVLIANQPAVANAMARRILTRLYQTLIAPVAAHLDDCTHLYLSLPPDWHDLPFAALWSDGYLLEHYQLTNLSAPDALLTRSVAASKIERGLDQRALIIGHSNAGQLPHAVVEAEAVAATLATGRHGTLRCELYCNSAATAASFFAAVSDATLIHIAAHAHFAPTGPLFSAIQLADRQLTLLELYHGTRLSRQPLVVLSTCVSGQGATRGGGLLGLARAFFAAGAGQLIVTGWQIDDRSTAELMRHFYTGITATPEDRDPGRALREAQLRLAATAHPFYWAGFLFIRG